MLINEARRRGFTLLELTLVGTFLAILGVLLAGVSSGLVRGLVDAVARNKVTHAANLASASLSHDLAGSVPGQLGSKNSGRYVGRLTPNNTSLWLCFDGGATPNGIADWAGPDTVITYEVVAKQLVRTNRNIQQTFTVTGYVDKLTVADSADGVQLQLTFSYRDTKSTYMFLARNP